MNFGDEVIQVMDKKVSMKDGTLNKQMKARFSKNKLKQFLYTFESFMNNATKRNTLVEAKHLFTQSERLFNKKILLRYISAFYTHTHIVWICVNFKLTN